MAVSSSCPGSSIGTATASPTSFAGSASGAIDLYLNTSPSPDQITFAPPQQIKLGFQQFFGRLVTVEVADLSGTGRPGIVYSNDTGQVYYAANIGTRAFRASPRRWR